MYNLLKIYQKKLTNLTSGNRSLLLRKLSSDNDLDLQALDYVDNKSAFQLLEEIVTGKKEIKLCDYIDSRDKLVNQWSRRIHTLWRKDRLITEERGAKDLYLGYPFVRGKLSDGSHIHCPLLFFPVDIELLFNASGKGEWKLIQRKNEQPTINKSFLLAYSHFNKIAIDDELFDYTFDDNFDDSLSLRNFLYKFLKDSPLEINFNTDLFQNKLQFFEAFTSQDFDNLHEAGKLKLYPEAILGFFPQSGSYLAPDYDAMLDNLPFKTMEDFFVAKIKETPKPELKEENLLTPFAIDASQENALKMVKSGHSIVVQGPPGTGKSQLICNLVCDFISKGKSVLVVCQKRAALDVVWKRLSEKKIKNFTALVHDFKNDRKQLYNQITEQVDLVTEYESQNNALDTIWLEREYLQVSRNIDRVADELGNFRKALFDESVFGIAVKTLYLESNPVAPHADLREECKNLNSTTLKELTGKFRTVFPYAYWLETEGSLWKERVNFKSFTHADLLSIRNILEKMPAFAENDYRETGYNSIELAKKNQQHHTQLTALKTLLANDDVFFIFLWWFKQKKNVNIQRITSILNETEILIRNTRLELSIHKSELNALHGKVDTAVLKFSGFLSKINWKIFSKDKREIKLFLVKNGLSYDLNGLQTLHTILQNRIGLEKFLSEFSKLLPVDMAFENVDLQAIEKLIHNFRLTLAAYEIYLSPDIELPFIPENKGFISRLDQFIQICSQANERLGQWKKFLSDVQIKALIEKATLFPAYREQLEKSFDKVVEYDRLLSEFSWLEKDIFYKCESLAVLQHISEPESFVSLVENSFYLGWIEQIENRFPVLRGVSTYKISQWENELSELVLKKQKLSNDILLLKVRERTYKNIEYNRLNNRTTYRELKHQATKKKKIWKLRKLLAEYKQEVFDIVPCWLASPETVSAIFPMEELFDLVIFDEASQCFAEKGLPAFYRGKQVVITGDDKQLPPSDLYQPRWEQSEDEVELNPDVEIDSLLNLAEKYLSQTLLTGHYRSKLPELINFSNQYFYRNNLKLLPDFLHMNTGEPAIEYLNVHGLWANNSNSIEAEEIVTLVTNLLQIQPEKTIGIVTFNARQQELIADLLEKHSIDNRWSIPPTLFVKNIENVQGDERDVIIFSIAYASDKSGKMQMQFGSLNQRGGENRLNVAITRAKEKIYVVSSIEAAQLKTEDTLHDGPKLLKLYLEYARKVSNKVVIAIKNTEETGSNHWLKNRLPDILPGTETDILPFADAVMKQKGKYTTLFLTDDSLFYNALSPKEFYAYRPLGLLAKNWKFQRLYSRNFWIDKQAFILSVKNTISSSE